MVNRITTKGQCFICNGTFSKSGMTKHLKTCSMKKVAVANKETTGEKVKTQDCLHVQVEGRYLPQYWMHLEMPAATTLAELDLFLRDIWLECCGHLSAFNVRGDSYCRQPDGDYDDKDMHAPLDRVVATGEFFTYEYDFGTTTELTLRLVGKSNKRFSNNKICVLAQNDEPEYQCSYCDKIAVQICSDCVWDDGGWLCEECSKEHDCGEDMLLPVVNSPRVGVCAYMG